MKLSNEQVNEIRIDVARSTISIESLKDDVLDHLCCVVEIKMRKGKAFDIALQEALHELAPNGLDEIQRETVYLLNSTKIILMKKAMYVVGLLSAMSFVAGWYFGIMHFPGATKLSVYGFSGFAFLYLPMMVMDHFKSNIHGALSEKLKLILGFACAFFIGLSGVFKVMQLQGAVFLLFIGAGLCIFGFLPFFFFSMYKKAVS